MLVHAGPASTSMLAHIELTWSTSVVWSC